MADTNHEPTSSEFKQALAMAEITAQLREMNESLREIAALLKQIRTLNASR